MAFIDANGKITIDDEAAAADIRNLSDAIERFEVVLSMINQMETMTENFKGNSVAALTESYLVLRTGIKELKLPTPKHPKKGITKPKRDNQLCCITRKSQ